MWTCRPAIDAIYANPDASEEDYMEAADLEARFAEYDGYTAESRAGELLLGLEIPVEQHNLPMREIAPGWKLPRAVGAGPVLESRCVAAGRTHQQLGHQHDSLAGKRAQQLPEQ